jgi:hypothetical protein
MLRISIDWTFMSPVLQIAIGTLIIENVETKKGYHVEPLITCEVKKERGTLGFKCIDSRYYDLFEEIKPRIDAMVESYYRGMLLESSLVSWIDDSADIPLKEWLEMKGINTEERIKHAEDTRVNL